MTACALALLLLMDVSGSVSDTHWREQRDGTAAAFREPAIARLIAGQEGVAVAVIAWGSGAHRLLPWRVLVSEAQAAAFAEDLAAAARPEAGQTDLALALEAAAEAFEALPCRAERRVADISGDGPANGPDPAPARAALAEAGVVLNGLPIVTAAEPGLGAYYRERVITPGGFVIEAEGWAAFGEAIRRKLALEVASLGP